MGPLSKEYKHIEDSCILEYFCKGFAYCASKELPAWELARNYQQETLGFTMYGFGSVFEKFHENSLEMPKDMKELGALLDKHLYVEGELKWDERAIRVLTDDDEVCLSYFLVEDEVVLKNMDKFAYLLMDDPLFPTSFGNGVFTSDISIDDLEFKSVTLNEQVSSHHSTYLCIFTFYDGDSYDCKPFRIKNVSLPQLPEWMGQVEPIQWSRDLLLLRAGMTEGIAGALEYINQYPLHRLYQSSDDTMTTARQHYDKVKQDALDSISKHSSQKLLDGDRSKSILRVSDHFAQLLMHCSDYFGYQQWFLFDDAWASENKDLANSILRLCAHWDILSS
jgi:hypothetical protein